MITRKQTLRERLAYNVQKCRLKAGFRREALSLALGWDNSYISKLEKGRVNITIDKLEQLSEILKIDVLNLLQEID